MTQPLDPRKFAVGDAVDGFTLEERLESGGMAAFWRVSRPGQSFPMVMKVPLLRAGEDPITIVGYEAEQMILPRLTGPHVPRFVAAGSIESPYIVMEFVPGTTVKALLKRTPLPVDEVAAIGAKIAHAIDDIHRQRVLHLDIKPSNVVLRDNIAVLIDFGLSHHELLPDLVGEESEGPVGTGAYIAPEQVLGDRGDPRSDLFALGVILYFLSTGERPFGEPTRAADWKRRLWSDPVPPRHRNKEIPPWLQEIILRCLEVDPEQRYASAAQLAFDLQHPDNVPLTARAERSERAGFIATLLRRMRFREEEPKRRSRVTAVLSRAPIILAAVDLGPAGAPLAEALLRTVSRLLSTEPNARLACITVLRVTRLTIDPLEDEQGRNRHLQQLIGLKHWAAHLPIDEEKVSCHVLESTDPATSIVDYARHNRVDHIVLGARGSSTLRRYLGSVSSQVVAQATCSVTVVRTADAATEPGS